MANEFGNAARHAKTSTAGPWTRWKKISRVGRCIKFIESYCRSPKGVGHGQLMKLGKFQKSWLEEALADGVDEAIMPTPRGNGKSTFGGAVAVWATFDDDETGAPQVPIVATTVGQAIRSVYGVAASMIRHEPFLADRCIEFTGIATPRVYVPRTEASMFPVSQEIAGLQGLDPSFAVIDELGFLLPEVRTALTTAAGKRSRSLIWGTGTPGLDRINALWLLREQVFKGEAPPGLVYREYAVPEDFAVEDRRGWPIGNPALAEGFLRESALVKDLGSISRALFEIFRMGRWVEGTTSWLGNGALAKWRALTDPWEIPKGTRIYVGMDAGIVSDATAIVIVAERPDGRVHAKLKLWQPTEEDSVDMEEVKDYLGELAVHYKLGPESIGVDPSYIRSIVMDMERAGLPVITVPNGAAHMAPIVGDVRAAIINGTLTHDGDRVFERHILNARAKERPQGMVLAKDKARSPIDAAIGLGLAYDRYRHKKKAAGVFVGSVG